ncbi:Protein M3 [Quaeritorhiza haematococci]|nr:Protein M3 [Quaeritorhiza haematococci]
MGDSTPTIAVGQLIWAAAKPMLKIFMIMGVGFILSKKDILTPIVSKVLTKVRMSRSLSQNVETDNLKQLSVLICASIFYCVLGHGFGLIISRTLRPPRHFRNGAIMATSMGNWGDLAFAVMLSLGNNPPFEPGGADIGVAYIFGFLVFANFYFFTVGYKGIGDDFRNNTHESSTNTLPIANTTVTLPPPHSPPSRSDSLRLRSRKENTVMKYIHKPEDNRGQPLLLSSSSSLSVSTPIASPPQGSESSFSEVVVLVPEGKDSGPSVNGMSGQKMVTNPTERFGDVEKELSGAVDKDCDKKSEDRVECVSEVSMSAIPSTSPMVVVQNTSSHGGNGATKWYNTGYLGRLNAWRQTDDFKIWFDAIANNCNIAIILGIIVSTVPALKSLFVPSKTSAAEPPLKFILETLAFVGAAAVPVGIMNLGAALGRLTFKSLLPFRIIAAVTLCRLIIIPVIGVTLTQVLTYYTPLIDPADKVLRFVLMFEACVPTASSAVYFTQYWNPTGEAIEMSSIILVQYPIALITLTGSMAVILNLLA